MHDEKLEGALLERFCNEWFFVEFRWSKIFSLRLDSLGWVFSLGSINRGSSPLLKEALSGNLLFFFFSLVASFNTHTFSPSWNRRQFFFSALSRFGDSLNL